MAGILAIGALSSVLLALLSRLRGQGFWSGWGRQLGLVLLLSVFVLVAYVTGFIMANSRKGVVGDVVPVVLAGFGGVMAWVFVKNMLHPAMAGLSVLVFTVGLFVGTTFGAWNRYASQAYQEAALQRVVEMQKAALRQYG